MSEDNSTVEGVVNAFKQIISGLNVKDMVTDNKMVTFVCYRKGELIYKTECGFHFPVPISDIGDATFNATDRAILFMRYIKKQIKEVEESSKVS